MASLTHFYIELNYNQFDEWLITLAQGSFSLMLKARLCCNRNHIARLAHVTSRDFNFPRVFPLAWFSAQLISLNLLNLKVQVNLLSCAHYLTQRLYCWSLRLGCFYSHKGQCPVFQDVCNTKQKNEFFLCRKWVSGWTRCVVAVCWGSKTATLLCSSPAYRLFCHPKCLSR